MAEPAITIREVAINLARAVAEAADGSSSSSSSSSGGGGGGGEKEQVKLARTLATLVLAAERERAKAR